MSSLPADKRILHKLDYYSNQEGIGHRYIRERENWNGHLSNTKRFILNAVRKCQPGVVTILGSGWLLDIPVAAILESAPKIRLVDIVHPPEILSTIGGDSRIEPVVEDVTGGLPQLVWELVHAKQKPEAEEIIREVEGLDYSPAGDQGLVISVNLLSQLPMLPFGYLKKKGVVDADLYRAFAGAVQENHLRFLRKKEGVLVTDFAELKTARDGSVAREDVVHCRLPAGVKREEWSWKFDSNGAYHRGAKTTMQVVALQL